MNNPANSDSDNQNRQEQTDQHHRTLFQKFYEIVAPKFLPAFGVLFVLAIGIAFSPNKPGAWFTGSLAFIFLLLFVFEIVRSHNLSTIIKRSIYILLGVAIIVCLIVGMIKLFPTEPSSSTSNLISSTAKSDTLYLPLPTDTSTRKAIPVAHPSNNPSKKQKKNPTIIHDTVVVSPKYFNIHPQNQSGGAVIGENNGTVNIDGSFPSVRVLLPPTSQNYPVGSLFGTDYDLIISSMTPLRGFRVRAWSPSIKSVQILPANGTGFIDGGGPDTMIPGYSTAPLRDALGKYRVRV